jgi:hypothetical protein
MFPSRSPRKIESQAERDGEFVKVGFGNANAEKIQSKLESG